MARSKRRLERWHARVRGCFVEFKGGTARDSDLGSADSRRFALRFPWQILLTGENIRNEPRISASPCTFTDPVKAHACELGVRHM